MAYADFTLESAEDRPEWLKEIHQRGRMSAAMVSEKARSEFIVAPTLLACRELVSGELAIFSGQRLDVDPSRGLVGECDYILARTAPVPRLRAPLVTIMEAKRGDIELGLGQCVAQMVAARMFNERAGLTAPLYGVLTTGEDWQFLKLDGDVVVLHANRLYLDSLGLVLAALGAAIAINN